MKQFEITLFKDSLWQPNCTPKDVIAFYNKIFSIDDVFYFKNIKVNKGSCSAKIFKDNIDISEEWENNDLSFTTICEELLLLACLGIIESNDTLNIEALLMNNDIGPIEFTYRGYKTTIIKKLFEDWLNGTKCHNNKTLENTMKGLFTTFALYRSIEIYPAKINNSIYEVANLSIDSINLFFDYDSKKWQNHQRYFFYNQIPNELKEHFDKYISRIHFLFDGSEKTLQKLYDKMSKKLNLKMNSTNYERNTLSFEYDPIKVDKYVPNYSNGILIIEEEQELKFNMKINNTYIIKLKSFKTLWWNIWGLILNGNIEVPDNILRDKYSPELIRKFIGTHKFHGNYDNVVSSIFESNIKKLSENKGYFSQKTRSYFVNGLKTLFNANNNDMFNWITKEELKLGYNRAKGAEKYIFKLLLSTS